MGAVVVVVVVAAVEEEVEGVQIQAAAVLWKAHVLMTAGPSALVQEHLELVYYTFDKENFLKTRLQFHSSENKQKNIKPLAKVDGISETKFLVSVDPERHKKPLRRLASKPLPSSREVTAVQ